MRRPREPRKIWTNTYAVQRLHRDLSASGTDGSNLTCVQTVRIFTRREKNYREFGADK